MLARATTRPLATRVEVADLGRSGGGGGQRGGTRIRAAHTIGAGVTAWEGGDGCSCAADRWTMDGAMLSFSPLSNPFDGCMGSMRMLDVVATVAAAAGLDSARNRMKAHVTA